MMRGETDIELCYTKVEIAMKCMKKKANRLTEKGQTAFFTPAHIHRPGLVCGLDYKQYIRLPLAASRHQV